MTSMAKITPARGVLKGGGNTAGGAAGNKDPQAVIGQPQPLAHQTVDGAAKVYTRAFAAAGLPGGQRKAPPMN